VSYREPFHFQQETSELRRRVTGMVRRALVTVTGAAGAARGIWQMTFGKPDGVTLDADEIEVFQGVGFASRPRSSSRAEAIVVAVGGSSARAAIALRDEDLRKLAAADLEEDETAIFTSSAIVRVTKDGKVKISTIGGTPKELAFADDLQAVVDYLKSQFDPVTGHVHVTAVGPTTGITESVTPGTGAGDLSVTPTSVLKAE
jgi:phage gp45-like